MQFVVVESLDKGIQKAKDFLYEEVDKKTVLFLSGGQTPKVLYESLAKDQIIHPAAVGMVDERFGKPMHEKSNEKMVEESGFLEYLKTKNIPFYSMLFDGINRQQAARAYDGEVRNLFFTFPKSVGIIGIGTDGHIASLVPNRADFINPLFANTKEYLYVSEFEDRKKYKERITLTFAGLSLLDFMIVFVFGKEKKWALEKTFTTGPLEEIPSRFFQQHAIAKKTVFISDQKV